MQVLSLKLAYASYVVICAFLFTSLSLSSLHHILLIIPGLFFLFKDHTYKKIQWKSSLGVLALLFIVSIISVIFNWSSIDKPMTNILKTKYFLFGILGATSLSFLKKSFLNEKRIRILLNLLLISTSVATISGLIGLYTGFNPLKMKDACHPTRACGLYGMYMTYGYGISLFMVLLTGLVIYRDNIKNYVNEKFLYLCWVINFLGLIFSFTRGGWIAFLLAIPFFFFKKHKKMFFKVFIVLSLFFAGTFMASSTIRQMFLKRAGSDQQRVALYETAYLAFKQKPILGFGYKNFEPNSKKIKEKFNIIYPWHGGHAHSNFLEHLASTGVIGFILLIFLHFLWLKESYDNDDLLGKLLFPFFISFSISGLFQYTIGDGENLFFLMGILSLHSFRYVPTFTKDFP